MKMRLNSRINGPDDCVGYIAAFNVHKDAQVLCEMLRTMARLKLLWAADMTGHIDAGSGTCVHT